MAAVGETLRNEGTMPAVAVLDHVIRDLDHLESPYAIALRVEKAGLLYHAGKFSEALTTLDTIQPPMEARKWPLLAARAAWNRGVSLASLGNVHAAAASYERALELYGRTGDKTQTGMLQTLLADNAEMAGRFDETWYRYMTALRSIERHGEPWRSIVILDGFTRAAVRAGHPLFARLLNDILIGRSQEPQDAPYLCHALVTACDVDARLDDRSAARRRCAEARQIFSGIVDSAVRDRLAADLDIATAAAADRSSRITRLTDAVNVSQERRDLFRLSRVLLLRGRAYAESGATELARTDFEHGLDLIEEQRQRLDLIADRLTYFEVARETAEELVRLLIERGETSDALAVVERVRARVLLDRFVGQRPGWSESALQSRLSSGHAVLQYWSDPSALYIWVLRRNATAFRKVDISRHELSALAHRFRAALESGNGSNPDALYGILFNPVVAALNGADSVIVIADVPIAGIPFAALRDDAGQTLVRQYAFTDVPSASALALLPAPAAPRSTLLLVNPTTVFDLPSLNVRTETRSAMNMLPQSTVREGPAATASALQALASEADLIHIAAHTMEIDGDAALALAPERDRDDGVVRISDIEQLRLRRGAIIVLAGCGTGRGKNLNEGTLTIARAFISAGAAAVLATYWDATDESSARLFPVFYSRFAAGVSTAKALRDAQLAMKDREPGDWAVYHLLGGL
jgi:CHAT domain-containing protein